MPAANPPCARSAPRLHPAPALVASLAALCSAASWGAEPEPSFDSPELTIEAPGVALDRDGTLVAPQGFVARIGERVLFGDALRYDRGQDDLYATGRVVLVMPQVRIHAARLGMHPQAASGEAWQVEAWVDGPRGRLPVKAAHVSFDMQRVVFSGVAAGGAHGGFIAIGARTITVHLRPKPAEDREGVAQRVSGISLHGPHMRVLGLPVLWLPFVHRDFTIDYPWTRFRYGSSRRIGTFLRSEIGTSIPEFWETRLRVRGRYDVQTRAGNGFGASGEWDQRHLGSGSLLYYAIEPEAVLGGEDDRTVLTERNAHVLDAEHRVSLPGAAMDGAGAIYGRWISLPEADPLTVGGSGAGLPPDERFRADYLREDLEHRPFARRGVTGVYGIPFAALVLDTERRRHPDVEDTERLFGSELVVPVVSLAGPLHVGGQAWLEDLRNETTDTHAKRLTSDAALSAMQWFGGVGLDASAGMRGLRYRDGIIAGAEVDDQGRDVVYGDAGIRLRMARRFANGVSHVVTTRAGVELVSEGRGEAFDDFAFGDARDRLEEDHRYLVTSVDTSVARQRELFRAEVVARWGLREEDRGFSDAGGPVQQGPGALVDVTANASGSPLPGLSLDGEARYDALRERYSHFDASAVYRVNPRLALRHSSALVVPELGDDSWHHRPGVVLSANRYRLDATVTMRDEGDAIDRWGAELLREMVDGELSLSYDMLRDETGDIYDRRFSVGFTIP